MKNDYLYSQLQDIVELSANIKSVPELHRKLKSFDRQYIQKKELFNNLLTQSDSQRVQLNHMKNHLNEQVEFEIRARQEKELILQQQAKMAAMGEMMDAVAHQWKQPLNALSMLGQLLEADFEEGAVDQPYITDMMGTVNEQIEHMVNTLAEFRSFFRPNKECEQFDLKQSIDSVLHLTKDEFIKNDITINVECDNNVLLNGIPNEFKHLLLNILNNAKDAFNERQRPYRLIFIRYHKQLKHIVLEIEDNAGGIPEHVIEDIFKPNVTTKEESNGTGIGLYMSAQIAEKLGGALSVANTHNGACFTLDLHVKDEVTTSLL